MGVARPVGHAFVDALDDDDLERGAHQVEDDAGSDDFLQLGIRVVRGKPAGDSVTRPQEEESRSRPPRNSRWKDALDPLAAAEALAAGVVVSASKAIIGAPFPASARRSP